MIKIPSSLRPADEVDTFIDNSSVSPSLGQYLKTSVSAGFRMTTTEQALYQADIEARELEEYGESPLEAERSGGGILGLGIQAALNEHVKPYEPKTLTADEWKSSPYYVEGAEWKDGWTEARAEVLKERYDKRRYEDELLTRPQGIGTKVLGFGANLIGNLPDPVNLIPFGAGIKGTALGATALRGFAEGATGAAVADLLVFPELKRQGEELTFIDAINDVVIGGVLGAGLSSVGYAASKYLRGLGEPATTPTEKLEFGELSDGTYWRSEDITPELKKEIERLTGTRFENITLEDVKRVKRQSRELMAGERRQDIYNALEKALDDMGNGKDVDVSAVLRSSSIAKQIPDEASPYINLGTFEPEERVNVTEELAAMETLEAEPVEILEFRQQEELGNITPEEKVEFDEAQYVQDRVDDYEEAGLGIIECVIGAK